MEGGKDMGGKSELSASQRQEIVLMVLRGKEPIGVPPRRCGVANAALVGDALATP